VFQVNDALVKDRPLAGVRILVAPAAGAPATFEGTTDDDGRLDADLEPGVWAVSYLKAGYVPVPESETEVRRAGEVITTSLSMMLEAEGAGVERRVRLVLNWGSGEAVAKDVDSHALCAGEQPATHVYFGAKEHQGEGHRLDLDVDDIDWGGPETVTLRDPLPGRYLYWVYNYSGSPPLGVSSVVVRVLFDDTMVAELRLPADLASRSWRPFREIVVDPDLQPRLVAFDAAELAQGLDGRPPSGWEDAPGNRGEQELGGPVIAILLVLLALVVGGVAVVAWASRSRR